VSKETPDFTSNTADDKDAVLSGTTLKVYRFMVSRGGPIGPRELQRSLHFSSPGLATFHLDKLAKAGLVSKSEDGTFSVDRIYLKHYVRVRRFLIPRYMFYATLSTAFLLGWIIILAIPSTSTRNSFWAGLLTSDSFVLLAAVIYGIVVTAFATIVLWYETINVLRNDKI
jgi:hypothetical protein